MNYAEPQSGNNFDVGRAQEIFEAHKAPEDQNKSPEEIVEKLKEYQQQEEYQTMIDTLGAIREDPGRAEAIFEAYSLAEDEATQANVEHELGEDAGRAEELFASLSKPQEELDALELTAELQAQGEDAGRALEIYEQYKQEVAEKRRNFIIRLGQLLQLLLLSIPGIPRGDGGQGGGKDPIWEYINSQRRPSPNPQEHFLRQQSGEGIFGSEYVKQPLFAIMALLFINSIPLGEWMKKYGKRQLKAMHLPRL